jgi:hypothetical protein
MNQPQGNKALSTARGGLSTAGRNVKRKTQLALEKAPGLSHQGNGKRASNGRGKRRRGRSLEQPREARTQASPALESPLVLATKSRTATSTERRSNDSSVRVSFKIRKDRAWKNVLVLTVDRSDPSEVERAGKNFMRQKLRLFDTNLRMMTLPECFETVIADQTNTILLIPETEIDISDELAASASSVHARALSRNKRSLRRIAAHHNSHTLHAHARSRTAEATPKFAHKAHNRDVHSSRRSSWYSDEPQYSPSPISSTMSVKVKSPLRFSKPFTDPWTQLLDSCPTEPEPPAPPSSESPAPRPGVRQDAALNVKPQLNPSSIRRRQRSESPESRGRLVIDEDRFAIKRSGKFQITENLWKIKDQKSEVQRLESSGMIDQGEFIRRFEKLGHECPDPGNMPFCILDEPSNSCTFVAPTANAPKLWRDLIRAHAKAYRVPYSFDQKKRNGPETLGGT